MNFKDSRLQNINMLFVFFLCSSSVHFRRWIFMDLGNILDDFWEAFEVLRDTYFLMNL